VRVRESYGGNFLKEVPPMPLSRTSKIIGEFWVFMTDLPGISCHIG
jgi:hypothetical protein